jgi:hypothetical protein
MRNLAVSASGAAPVRFTAAESVGAFSPSTSDSLESTCDDGQATPSGARA